MKVGDTVRFLNDVGGGIVKGFEGKDVVLVEDGDGFEIPVLIRECVVIDSAYDVEIEESKTETKIANIELQEEEDIEVEETKEGELLSLHLAFIPIDIKNMSTTGYRCYIVNDSNYYISFSYLNKVKDAWLLKNLDTVEPNFKLYLRDISKDELNDLQQSCIQLFAYKKDKAFDIKEAESIEIRIDPVRFYKLHSFKDSIYFDEPAMVYTIIDEEEVQGINISAKEIAEAMQTKEKSSPKRLKIVKKKKKKSDILEVDLHIHELIDNTAGLQAAEIIKIQMDEFHRTMDENKNNKELKIVFIHGKGNGVLKNEITKSLREQYRSSYFQDASFQEYGFGATMVTIK